MMPEMRLSSQAPAGHTSKPSLSCPQVVVSVQRAQGPGTVNMNLSATDNVTF